MDKRSMKRHVRWNWEQSPENPELARYHFIVVDDKDREGIMRRITEQLSKVGAVERVRSEEGKVERTEFRYLFETYDSAASPIMILWHKVGRPVRKDPELRERKRGNVEDYVAELYS